MEQVTQKHNYGIDILKIVTMFMIVLWHLMGHGGLLKSTVQSTPNYNLAWIIESILYSVVDIYVMITGYLYIRSKWRVSSIIKLWTVVVFYGAAVPVTLKIFGYNIGVKTIIKGAFPILQNEYWYFTQYVALFFSIPLLNFVIYDRKKARYVLVAGTIILSVVPMIAQGRDLFFTNDGFSFLWFMFLYCWGAYIGLNGLPIHLNRGWLLLLYVFDMMLLVFSKIGWERIEVRVWGGIRYAGLLHNYTSPLVLLAAIIWLKLFADLKINHGVASRIVCFFSPLTFGVYLIHEHPCFREFIISEKLVKLAFEDTGIMIVKYFGIGIAIFIGCLTIDLIRKTIFNIIHINDFIVKVVRGVHNILKRDIV